MGIDDGQDSEMRSIVPKPDVASFLAPSEEPHTSQVPKDLHVLPTDAAQVDQTIAEWETNPTSETQIAKDMVQVTLKTVDSWIPGENKKLGLTTQMKAMRDALVSDDSDFAGKIWDATLMGGLDAVRGKLDAMDVNLGNASHYMDVASDVAEADHLVTPAESAQESWKSVLTACVVTGIQDKSPRVRGRIVATLTNIGNRLGREAIPERFDKALSLVTTAIEPIEPQLLATANKNLGVVQNT